MKRKLTLRISIFLFFITVCQSLSFSQTLWEQWVSETSSASKIITTYDKGYIVCADGSFFESYLIKFDSLGNVKWTTMTEQHKKIYTRDFVETENHQIVVLGYNRMGKVLQKYDGMGNFLWEKYYDHITYCDIIKATENEIITSCGGSFSKFDANGILMSEGGHIADYSNFIAKYRNTIIVESSDYIEQFNEDFQLINKKNMFTDIYDSYAISTDSTKLVCIRSLYKSNKIDFFNALTLDSISSEITTDYNIGQNSYIRGIISTPDLGFLLFGISQVGGPQYQFIIKVDSIGEVLWSRNYYFGINCEIKNVVNATDGAGYALLVSNYNDQKSYLVRVGEYGQFLGISDDTIPLEKTEDFISIFPNPASNYINIIYSKKIDGEFKFFDFMGNLLKTGIIKNEANNSISISEFPSGAYLFQVIKKNNESDTEIFIKQ